MIITDLFEAPQLCPECGGISFSDLILAEKKDACYYKVKASAKVWPSAYASGRLVQCRKKGADNYGNKNESTDDNFGKPAAMMKASPETLKTAQAIVQKQADKNVISQAKIAGAVPYQGVAEGMENSPVADAMFARLQQRPDLLRRYGVEYVIQAVHDVADSVGAVDEIGSSDVSGWMRQLELNLKNKLNQYDEPMSDIDRLEEANDEKIAGRHDPEEFDAMIGRLRQLAGEGPRKTVWDPVKRVYKTVPVNAQPQANK
jgi:hypothetical protein